ncbi:hypothetical protein EV143_107138 [Flavobacterium chryseum]|uniref:hypothetical protein n=1 Tax=Flavobacterium sp. P3160 TaxID=2512113 RepID=UPI00105FDE9D|nr:hypothetical protein [Flavobacterium sp. P3160]TDO72832.1 hypothetical protein EV143_107138 [Flavobacterium sp. P3160]
MSSNFVFYINSDILDSSNFLDYQIDAFIKSVNPILNVGRKLKAKIYYSNYNIKSLVEYFDEPSFNKDFTKSQANKLELLLKNCIKTSEANNFFRVHFAGRETSLEFLEIPFINPSDKDKIVIFNLSQNLPKQSVLFVKSNDEFERIEINSFCEVHEIWKFVNNNLPIREYNFSSKHGNSTTRAIAPNTEDASQLLCTDEEANSLLKTAIFDLRERNWCYNFDEDKQTFIIFPCEGDNPQNKFHAFHIDKDKWREEIPKSILKHFNKN